MGKANAAMAAMGATNDPKKVAAAMQQFQKENAKMEMGQEMMDDTLDGVFDDDEVEGETDDLMNQASLGSFILPNALSPQHSMEGQPCWGISITTYPRHWLDYARDRGMHLDVSCQGRHNAECCTCAILEWTLCI